MDTAESRRAEADRRRNMEGNILFQDLGKPIQQLLQAVSMSITNEELALLSKVSVRLLTKVFNMLSAEEDPDKILSWLREETKRQNQNNKVDPELQKKVAKDPIAFYKELEKRNEAMLDSFRQAEEDRERQRLAGLAARKARREEAERKAREDAARAAKNGDTTDAVDRLNKQDAADIAGAFNRFVDKNGTFDNTNATQDTEWWKKDEYRRDYEKNKRKGKLWTRVVEGGTQQIPDSELAAREEWFKSYCWWKNDKFRRDWLASRDAEWWKEETYIKEWQDKGDKGCMWLAADETTGFNKKGHRRPAAKAELERRVMWYKDNGPKGIVKKWCALAEGQQDRCTLEEKLERDDYYKNGDWWKSDGFVRKAFENPSVCDAIVKSGAAAEDRDWWKDEQYRRDFCRDGKKWKLANEKAAIVGQEDALATEAELARRQEWFQNNWWKTEALLEDYTLNGEKGMKWCAANESDLAALEKNPTAKINVCSVSDRKVREDWFRSADERQWWKDPVLIRDWEQNGKAGKKWTAAWREAALDSTGDMYPADSAALAEREAWFKKNFWKTDKYIKDFQAHGAKGTAWKATNLQGHEDKDWWKQGDMQRSWLSNRAANLTPFWQQPEMIADYFENGTDGKKWNAKNAAAAAMDKGDVIKADAAELAERENFYQQNWWRAPEYQRDFAANGKHGKLWRSAAPDGEGGIVGNDELRRRREFFSSNPKKHSPNFNAMLETDALNGLAHSKFAKWGRLEKREEFYKKNWWKVMPEIKADFLAFGEESKLLKAKTPEAAVAGLSDDPTFQATPAEIKERIDYFNSGASENTDGDDWWKAGAFAKEWAAGKAVPFWQNPDMIQDFLDNGAGGKKWTAKNAAAAAQSLGGQPDHRAEAGDLAKREDFFRKHFWQATKYQDDFETNGDKGTLWTMSEPGGKGEAVSEGELGARQAWYRPTMRWQLADKPQGEETPNAADAIEVLDRDEWFKKNWWKNPIVKNDYLANGKASKLLRAANADVVILGLQDDPTYHASDDEINKRIEYFETCGDNEWWKAPAVIEDYVKWHKEGAVWQSRNLAESKMSMGMENPAPEHELTERSDWYENNYWKTPDAIRDYQMNGAKGSLWKAGRDGTTPVSASELPLREAWLKANACCDTAEESRRKSWLQQQLTDEEACMRRQWLVKKGSDSKRIHVDELPDLLAQINDGHKPTDDQLQCVLDAIRTRRSEIANEEVAEVGEDGITQEEFVTAVANTNFYVSATDEERLRAEQEALDALQREEMERQDEVAGLMAMEAQEELDNAGFEEHEEVDGDEAAFLDEMEEEDLANRVNEDDGEVDEGAWQEFLEQQGDEGEELSDEQLATLQAEEEERQAAEAARAEAEAAVWEDGEYGGEEGEDDAEENPADLDEDAKEELEAVVNEEWDEVADEDLEEEEEEEEIDEMQMEEKGQPMQWKLPLREVTNPQYLKAYFTVIKYTPSHSFLGGKQKRVWVVDHFTRCFYNLEKSGKIKKEHAANKLLQLERNLVDATRLRLMFFDASHSYELQFFNARERERFYETASAIRPSIRVYAPDLTNQDANVEACTTTIDGVGPNSVSVVCNNAQGKPVNRELTGECKINASKLITEPLTVWVGTFNLAGARPPKNKNEISDWMPKDKYDIYAIAVQEASYRKEESEWFDYVQAYLGREYLTLASMNLWDTLLIVLTRKKHLLKITNVEGSTKATVHKAVCGTKGGIGISMRYLETSMCFVTCHLAARIERAQMRNTNVEEIVDNLQLGIRETDFTNQFNHVFFFGDFNYRTEVDAPTADRLIAEGRYAELTAYDQFTQQRANEGILYGFTETPITFAPTYRLQPGTGKYMIEKGNASSYCDRVLTRSMANTWIKCTSYKSIPSVTFSEHTPIAATYIVRCVRPVLSCFMRSQRPIPVFHFKSITVKDHTGVIINKPAVIISSPFFGSTKPFDSKTVKTQNPSWAASEIPSHESITQVQELIETGHIVFILREAAEKREDKAHRGSGHLTMLGRVVGQEGVEQDFEIDLMNHGRRMGRIVGRYMWVAAK